jgi:hypothetical protein
MIPSSVPFAFQVGGHQGVSTTEDGSLLFKPALAREVEFYSSLSSRAELAALRQFVPKFLGTLRLQGRVEDVDQNEVALKALNDGVEEDKDESQIYFKGILVLLIEMNTLYRVRESIPLVPQTKYTRHQTWTCTVRRRGYT